MTGRANWKRLVRTLDAWTAASESVPGRIEVSLPDGTGFRQVTIVMTEDEWDTIVGPMWGDIDDAIAAVKRTLAEMEPHQTYALYGQYDLVPSTEATWPEEPEIVPQRGGGWFAYNRDGRPGNRFADFVEPPDEEDWDVRSCR